MEKQIFKTRILLVEDHVQMRKIIKTILMTLGFRNIAEAGNGSEALSLLQLEGEERRSDKVSLIICDWMMPHMTGIELLRAVRASQGYGELPFLMLTSESGVESVTSAVAEGVTDYIVKPFNAKILEHKVMSILSQETNGR